MTDPRQIAAGIVGAVDWQTEVSGFCRCPGEALHTQHNGKKDCRINVDGAPTIYYFHSSCAPMVAEANRRLRRAIGQSPWEITLPGGRVLRNGDVLQASGAVLPREAGEQTILETVRVMAERFAPEMFKLFHWPFAQIVADSPLQVSERDAEDQFRTWLRLWPAHCHVWIGDVFSSGKPEHKTNFRPVADWC